MYPEEVFTTSRKGVREVRVLIDSGKFFRYKYVDPESGKAEEKVKILLVTDGGRVEEFFVFPVKGSKFLFVPQEYKGRRAVWDGEKPIIIP
ncbi:MAG: hypothetical protein N3F63_07020 [Thermoplasmata archaeon]|nr:hypothetical protein [Thermoplasmata archaeon]